MVETNVKRLLTVGLEIPNFESIPWSEWSSSTPLDYQGLLFDCRKTNGLPDQYSVIQTLSTRASHGHSAYIILPEASGLGTLKSAMVWVPNAHLYVRPATGQARKLASPEPLFENYIKIMTGHEIYFELQATAGRTTTLIPGIVNNVSQAICGRSNSIYLLHLPRLHLSGQFVEKSVVRDALLKDGIMGFEI